jgi:hypothetical protein
VTDPRAEPARGEANARAEAAAALARSPESGPAAGSGLRPTTRATTPAPKPERAPTPGPAPDRIERLRVEIETESAAQGAGRGTDRPPVTLSLVVPLFGPSGGGALASRIDALARAAERLVGSYESIVIADAARRDEASRLARALEATFPGAARTSGPAVFALDRDEGESAVLRAALRLARGAYVVVVPAEACHAPGIADALAAIVERLRAGDGLVLGRRERARGGRLAVALLRRASGLAVSDPGCGVRGLRRAVAKELADAENLALFLPYLVHRNGHRVSEVPVDESVGGAAPARLHDALAVLFLMRFARAPLRMFGSIGALVSLGGVIITASVAADRILNGVPLARRPILLLGVLLIVVGVQTIALGLVGEITVFARTRRHREYRVDRVL